MKNLKTLIGIIVLLIMMASCTNDSSSSTNKMRIFGKATYTNAAKTNVTLSPLTSGVVLTSFKINIKEIEFEIAEGNEDGEDNDPSEEFSEEIPMEIIKNESLSSEISDISLPIVLEEEEVINVNSKIDDIPFEINTGNDETDVPMTIKSKPDENSNSDLNEGAQLGLF